MSPPIKHPSSRRLEITSGCSISTVELHERIVALRQGAWLREASDDVLTGLANASSVHEYLIGATLFLEGEPVRSVFVLLSGFARSYRFEPRQNREITVGTYGIRQPLGVVSAFLEPARYSAGADMLQGGRVLRIGADAVREVAACDASFSLSLLRHVTARHARLTERIGQLVLHDLNSRLSLWLLERVGTDGQILPRNSVLAAELGTVPELVSRKLGELYRRGWIRLQGRRVWVVDVEALRRQVRSG